MSSEDVRVASVAAEVFVASMDVVASDVDDSTEVGGDVCTAASALIVDALSLALVVVASLLLALMVLLAMVSESLCTCVASTKAVACATDVSVSDGSELVGVAKGPRDGSDKVLPAVGTASFEAEVKVSLLAVGATLGLPLEVPVAVVEAASSLLVGIVLLGESISLDEMVALAVAVVDVASNDRWYTAIREFPPHTSVASSEQAMEHSESGASCADDDTAESQ